MKLNYDFRFFGIKYDWKRYNDFTFPKRGFYPSYVNTSNKSSNNIPFLISKICKIKHEYLPTLNIPIKQQFLSMKIISFDVKVNGIDPLT